MTDIANRLKQYNNFQECIIEDIVFNDYGTSILIFFNYIWTYNNKIRENLDEKLIVTLKFILVNKFLIENNLNQAIIDEPYMMNWGLNEISTINCLESLDNRFFRVEIIWETQRKIILEFKELIIE